MFSENGIWLAAVAEQSTSISIWDIRKSNEVKSIETGGIVDSLDWDYTGQFLVSGGSAGVTVNQYAKSSKVWSEALKLAVPVAGIAWGRSAQSLVGVSSDGSITVLG